MFCCFRILVDLCILQYTKVYNGINRNCKYIFINVFQTKIDKVRQLLSLAFFLKYVLFLKTKTQPLS